MGKKRKAPKGCFWKDGVLYGAKMHNRIRIQWSLNTDNPAIARKRREETVDAAIAERLAKLAPAPEAAGDGTIPVPLVGSGRKTFADGLLLLPGYFADRAVSNDTALEYYGSLGLLDEWLRDKFLDEINNALISEIVIGRRADGVTNATIKRNLNALSAVMRAAVAKGWLEHNPVLAALTNIRETRDPIVLPERAHIDLVISRCPGMIADMVEVACRTGAREDELLKLRRSDIDHERMQMIIRRIGRGGPKRGKTRYIDLTVFDGYSYIRVLPAYAKSDFVFWHHNGLDYRQFAKQFWDITLRTAEWAKENGISFRRFKFHDLRHYHAVMFLKDGRDIYDLQKRLGHSSIKVTEQYLAYLTAEEERICKFGKAAGARG